MSQPFIGIGVIRTLPGLYVSSQKLTDRNELDNQEPSTQEPLLISKGSPSVWRHLSFSLRRMASTALPIYQEYLPGINYLINDAAKGFWVRLHFRFRLSVTYAIVS